MFKWLFHILIFATKYSGKYQNKKATKTSEKTRTTYLYDVYNVKLQPYAKGLAWSRGGWGRRNSVKLFLFPIC